MSEVFISYVEEDAAVVMEVDSGLEVVILFFAVGALGPEPPGGC